MIHNPDKLKTPGEGYRFLNVDELRFPSEDTLLVLGPWKEIEMWISRTNQWSAKGWWGATKTRTFRTKLSPEALTTLRAS